MTLYPNEREVQFKFCVHLFGCINWMHLFGCIVFNHPIFFIRNACFHRRNRAVNMLGKNRGFDLNVIRQQVDAQRMTFD